ncbi:MAG: UDP-N-acetylmuramate dehydrogenase [Candidatus Omnitrophota bacterium]|jgi:UDP-N-acetylmuramate dehydrogenase|nr:MAG: UDP-N-acetylmuramate dehydrogenase [Candidatus Omnitrophota bacterium]
MVGHPSAINQNPKDIEHELRLLFGDILRCNIALSSYTTLQIGGPADFLLELHHTDDVIRACRAALQLNLPFHFLAGCSNVLIDDCGLRGLVVINRTETIDWQKDFSLRVDGGYSLDLLVERVSERGWADLTFAAGIPGSIGGALVGGAGAFGHLVHEYLLEAEILRRDGTTCTVTASDLGIRYRESDAKQRGDIILAAAMGNFTSGFPDQLVAEIHRIRAEREIKHPGPDLPSAGSFFKNLPPATPGGRRIPAGKLLEEVGAKDIRIGGAGVFHKHANIIVNYGGATANQINELADIMAERVKLKFGIELEREVQYLC